MEMHVGVAESEVLHCSEGIPNSAVLTILDRLCFPTTPIVAAVVLYTQNGLLYDKMIHRVATAV